MLLFVSLATLLLALTMGLIVWPFLRRRNAAQPQADAAALAVYRDQKRQLDEDFAAGAISQVERDTAVTELARRLAVEVDDQRAGEVPSHASVRAWPVVVAVLVLLPLGAYLLYARLGNPDAIVAGDTGSAAAHDTTDKQIRAMVERLGQRLQEHPDDADGWMLLARSYGALGRFQQAAEAYARADALTPDNPSLLADYADALAMAQGRQLAGKPADLVRRALAIDPKHPKALALAATAALEARDVDGALGFWRRLQAQLPEGSDEAQQVGAIVAELESAKRDGKGSAPAAGKQAAPAQQPAIAAAATKSAGTAAGTVSGRVDVGSALAGKVALNDTVFIYARAADGPRMPLAVLRIPAKELPRDFALDDSMGMAPGAKLSAASQVIVEARISKSGNAIPQPGDLFGRSPPIRPGTAGVSITIDKVVP